MDFLSQATIDSGGITKGPQRRDGAGVDDDDKRWGRSKGFASHKSQRKRRWISFDSRSLQVSSSLARSAKHRGRSESGDRSVGYYRLFVGWETRPEMNPQVYGLRSAIVKQSRLRFRGGFDSGAASHAALAVLLVFGLLSWFTFFQLFPTGQFQRHRPRSERRRQISLVLSVALGACDCLAWGRCQSRDFPGVIPRGGVIGW